MTDTGDDIWKFSSRSFTIWDGVHPVSASPKLNIIIQIHTNWRFCQIHPIPNLHEFEL